MSDPRRAVDFFAGTKGKQFLQVGNAVPPLLAEAILKEVLDIA